jgi:predicted dehydrogenase
VSAGGAPLRTVVVGAGNMGVKWATTVRGSAVAELVGVADLAPDAAGARLGAAGLADVPVAASLAEALAAGPVDLVVNATVPEAHHGTTTAALRAGVDVLSEKPAAATLAQALSLAAAAQAHGRRLAVSQSRRYHPQLERFREQVEGLGPVGMVTTEFFRAPRFGGFRERMADPLLVDMAIHPFDTVRHLLDQEPVAVYAEAFNPGWSWYDGNAAAAVVFEMSGGTRYVYAASWCSPGAETSWNGSWRVSAAGGTARWDGDHPPQVDSATGAGEPDGPDGRPTSGRAGIDAALHEFAATRHAAVAPRGDISENLVSLAMVEAALTSSAARGRVLLADVLAGALATAVAEETDPAVAQVLAGWAGRDLTTAWRTR